jgi:hypothetical protein
MIEIENEIVRFKGRGVNGEPTEVYFYSNWKAALNVDVKPEDIIERRKMKV